MGRTEVMGWRSEVGTVEVKVSEATSCGTYLGRYN